MPGKCRPTLREKTLENVKLCNLSQTDKECIAEVFKAYENEIALKELCADVIRHQKEEIERLETEKDNLIKTYAECQKAFLKEYIDELKAELLERGFYPVFIRSAIDKVGKKMVGDNNV